MCKLFAFTYLLSFWAESYEELELHSNISIYNNSESFSYVPIYEESYNNSIVYNISQYALDIPTNTLMLNSPEYIPVDSDNLTELEPKFVFNNSGAVGDGSKYSDITINIKLGLAQSTEGLVVGSQMLNRSKSYDPRCLSVTERDLLECRSFEDKSMLGEITLQAVSGRWNSLGCSTIDRSQLSQLIKVSTEPIYYLGTHEGFCSHMLQYNTVWNWATAWKRSVIVFDYISDKHFGNISLSVCDVFKLPKTFTCHRSEQQAHATQHLNCIVVGEPGHWNTLRHSYDLNASVPICKDVNIRNSECIAGFLPALNVSNVIYPPLHDNLFGNYTFRSHYNKLFLRIGETMGLREKRTVVIHWRRGDQNTRCLKGADRSVNCKDAQEFIKQVKSISKEYGFGNFTIYVSTNENSTAILSKCVTNAPHVIKISCF